MEQWNNVAMVHVLLIITAASFVSSVFSTLLVDRFLTERISIIGSVVGLERTLNDGIAFGIDLPEMILFILIPAALILIAMLAWKSKGNRVMALGFGLLLGGALGNIADRFDDGHVTDFIQIGWWPLFNIADSCITIGVIILLLWEMKEKGKRIKGKEQEKR